MDIQTNKFKELWKDFVTGFKGNLITESKRQPITLVLARLALADALLSWTSEYTINGRWLNNLIKEEPEKGELVKEILTKDVTLTEVAVPGKKPAALGYAVPLGAGAVGYAAAHYAALGTVGTVCATAIPAIVAYPLMKSYLDKSNQAETTGVIDGYVRQLDKYREAVLSALLAQTD